MAVKNIKKDFNKSNSNFSIYEFLKKHKTSIKINNLFHDRIIIIGRIYL